MGSSLPELMKITIVAVLCSFLLLLLLPYAQSATVKYCDKKGNYAVKVQGVEISPDPVVSGQPATFNISASTGKPIADGKLVIEVSYLGIHVHTETHRLSEEVSLPIKAGNFVLSHTQTLPGFTPPGLYSLKMTLEDDNRLLLTCISFNFKIKIGSSVSAAE